MIIYKKLMMIDFQIQGDNEYPAKDLDCLYQESREGLNK